MGVLRKTGRRSGHDGARVRVSYANVAATLALVVALGTGSAWAAHHYLITSTNQIKPSVLKNLKGANGRNGTNGTDGRNGTDGTAGAVGPTFSADIGGTPSTPPPSSAVTLQTLTVSLPSAGNLMITASFFGNVECIGDPCSSAQVDLLLDGQPVPGSLVYLGMLGLGEAIPASGQTEFVTSGRVSAINAGQHTITLQAGNGDPCTCEVDARASGKIAHIDAVLTG